MLIGRDGECARIRTLLAHARNGQRRVVALRGGPGIGKTRLLEYAAEAAVDFRLVRVQGDEAERDIPYAALSMLVGPLLADTALPDVAAAALDGALNLGSAVYGDRRGVAAATLAVLAACAARQPLLLAVDDVHMIDSPTLDALFFALHRTHGERLAVVLTARSEPDVPDAVERRLDGFDRIGLTGLNLDEARRLTAHRGALPEAVWAASGGNPLALLEMTAPNSTVFLDEPLQLPARLMRAYGHKLIGLTDATREALLLVAVAGRAGAALDDALALRGLGRSDLEAAEDAGLVEVEPGAVRFAHPLVRSAVYHSSSPAVRRSAHRTLTAAYAGRRAPEAATRRAFHLAAATAGPDEAVAAQLAAAAGAATERHSHATAAALFEKAALLSPSGAARTRRIIDAAMAGQAAGTLDAVGPLLDTAIAETDDDELRTTATYLACRLRMWSGLPARARDELLELADRTEGRYREWSAAMRAQVAVVSIALGEQRLARRMAARAKECCAHLPDVHIVPVLLVAAVTHAINGEVDSARALLERCAPHLPGCDPLSIDQPLVLAALTYACLGDVAVGRGWLETSVRRTEAVQAVGLLPFQLSWLTLLCWFDGDWGAALAHGHRAVALAEETGWHTELPNCLVTLATVEATLGREDEARMHLARAAGLGAEQSGARLHAAHEARITGLIELGAGRPAEAAAALGVAAEFALACRMGDSVLYSWAANLTEALVRAGRGDEAGRAYRSVLGEAERTRRPAALAAAARCRGLLADTPGEAEQAFDEALSWHEKAGLPFETARTRLCYGEFLRRDRQRVRARDQLGAALATFDRLGAVAWARRAEVELRATGARSRSRTVSAAEVLTPAEMQVAIVVAEGLTNAEVATRLFVTPKTVEYHLSNIYRKLGLRSRVELASRVATGIPQQRTGGGEFSDDGSTVAADR